MNLHRYLLTAILLSFAIWCSAQTLPKRYVLIEEFTNTYCPNCINANPAFYSNILDNYQDTEVHHISYHPSYPSTQDPFYQFNPTQNEDRANYYSSPGTPRLYIRGTYNPNGPGGELLPISTFTNFTGQSSPIEITVTEQQTGTQRAVSVWVNSAGVVPSGNYTLHAVVVERYLTYTPAFPNQETEQHNIFRQAINNGWSGSGYVSQPIGVSATYEFTYSLNATWQPDEIYVIAFVQNNDTKEILNSGSSWGNITQVPVTGIEANDTEGEITLYPNPCADALWVSPSLLPDAGKSTLTIYNAAGKQVMASTLADARQSFLVNTQHWASGVYYLQLSNAQGSISRKFVKQ